MKGKKEKQTARNAVATAVLLLVEERDVRCVTSILQLVDRNEMKGGGVNDVALAGGRCRVGKHMAKPSITSLGAYLRPLHFVCVVGDFDEEIFRNGFRERGQADVAVEFVD